MKLQLFDLHWYNTESIVCDKHVCKKMKMEAVLIFAIKLNFLDKG